MNFQMYWSLTEDFTSGTNSISCMRLSSDLLLREDFDPCKISESEQSKLCAMVSCMSSALVLLVTFRGKSTHAHRHSP